MINSTPVLKKRKEEKKQKKKSIKKVRYVPWGLIAKEKG